MISSYEECSTIRVVVEAVHTLHYAQKFSLVTQYLLSALQNTVM